MMKIKLFLGAYINSPNAQNINCLALAEFMDKDKFEIYTLARKNGNIDITHLSDSCNTIKYNKNFRFTKVWKYIFALYKCDILYLPKQEKLKVIVLLNKLFFRKKLFITIEGIFDDYALNVINQKDKNGLKKSLNTINLVDNRYSISEFCKNYNANKVALSTKDKILRFGVDTSRFSKKTLTKNPLENIVFIGRDMLRKGINEYLELAKLFPSLTFHIVGKCRKVNFVQIKNEYNNVKIHGGLTPDELNKLLQTIDLHILPSKSEGFPKVILETSAVGIPSLVYSHYGANEYIKHNMNGFVVDDFTGLKNSLSGIQADEQLLFDCAKNCVKIADKFDWKDVVKDWEQEIIKLNSNNKHYV
ncbi:MAG: glycosyltransferase family 4 protein [Methylococcales symbiont of Hymedesmia sp. n. MRB-2018]|nr:MAG: glycosyltransferase family 4 protein [Methylococcales symbiont of Hymedesmia sp. n. MRB-2018]